ncbi:MAG TPA: hypothetical protein VGO62_14415 [Myxococcota bacterium]|jgi:hypothetical protein
MRISASLGLLLPMMIANACTCGAAPLATTDAGVVVAEGEGEGGASEGEGEGGGAGEGEGEGVAAPALYLALGDDLPAAVAQKLDARIRAATALPVIVLAPTAALPGNASGQLIAIGHTAARASLISDDEIALVAARDNGSDGYVLRSASSASLQSIAVAGRSPRGSSYGAYALLEQIGFAFMHPLAPTVPAALPATFASVDVTTAPRWRVRNIHLHSMHPLELTEMLNGWGDGDPNDEAGFTARLPEWDSFLEWMLANGDDEVEWVLLEAADWSDFAQSDVREQRLATLVDHAHQFGLLAGIDVPIAETQQHTFRLLNIDTSNTTVDQELAAIDARLDYLMAAGFDFLSTENGTTEFTHPAPDRMLAWMSEVAIHVDTAFGKRARIKAHCSTGQTADPLTDPDTGGPLNFNFLPELADPRLGVMPHTVQIYGIKDPAPTYGNTDFGYMADFLAKEVGTREVVWHPESAYWVSYDVDVPLFLPIYAQRRLSDLRELARREDAGQFGVGAHAGERMDGQSEFSSGWEWGYWLNDVVAARASWDPHTEAASDDAATRLLLAPLERALGASALDTIFDAIDEEDRVLIHGEVAGAPPADIVKRSGIAYLQGVDAFDDLPQAAASLGINAPVTEPDKLGLVEMRNPLHAAPRFTGEVDGLVDEMRDDFASLADQFDAASAGVSADAQPLYGDLADSLRITSLRARQVAGLYHYVDGILTNDPGHLEALADARAALDDAQAVVDERLPQYRVPSERISGWRVNPTAYDFTYLWSVKTLYYWWRDEGKAVDAPLSPCYQNIVNPGDVALGEQSIADAADILRQLTQGGFLQDLGECTAAPATEPTFPQDDLRSRP